MEWSARQVSWKSDQLNVYFVRPLIDGRTISAKKTRRIKSVNVFFLIYPRNFTKIMRWFKWIWICRFVCKFCCIQLKTLLTWSLVCEPTLRKVKGFWIVKIQWSMLLVNPPSPNHHHPSRSFFYSGFLLSPVLAVLLFPFVCSVLSLPPRRVPTSSFVLPQKHPKGGLRKYVIFYQ